MQNFMKTILSAIQTWTKGKIKESVADWNENDSSKDNYVKNRTHWEEEAVIVAEREIDGFVLMQEPIYAVVNPFKMNPVVGSTYTVVWDGVSYDVKMQDFDGLGCIGNTNYVYMESGGNIPFAIIFEGDVFLVTESTAESHTISISGTAIHKLDSKYLDLPTNLATTDDVQEAVDVANEAQNTATTAQNTATTAQNTANKKMNTSNPNGTGSFSMNRKSGTTTGYMSVAVGSGTEASGDYSLAEGNGTVASGSSSHVEGRYNYEELYCDKITNYSLTGIGTTVYEISGITPDYNKGWYIVETVSSSSIGLYGVNIGSHYIRNLSEVTYLDDGTATIKGYMTATRQDPFQAGIGYKTYFDKIDMTSNKNKYVHIVGNGTSDSSRSNANTLDWDGNAWYAGDVYVGSTSGINRDEGSKKLATEEYVNANSIPIPSTASVGQTIQVSAVDDNGAPIEWECVDQSIDAPIARVIQTDSGASIYIRDKDGETKAVVTNGKDGYTPKYGVDYVDGKDGNGIKSAVLNADYTLTLTFDDDTSYTTPSIRGATGAAGKDGVDGEAGADGVGIESIKQTTTSSADGGLNVFTVTLDNGTSATFTVKNGSKGSTGAKGSSGYTPVKGVDYFNDEDKAEWEAYIASELAKRGQLAPEFANSVEECTDTTKMYVLPDGFIYAYVMTEKEGITGSSYTNLLPLAINENGKPYVGANGENGYNSNFRVSSSGAEKAATNYYATGFIPVKAGDTVRIKGMNGSDGNAYCVAYYAADDMVIKSSINPTYTLMSLSADAQNVRTFSPSNASTAYMRLTFMGNPADIIITVNEEIVEGGGTTTTVKEYAWVSTGRAFVPADYEDRIVSLENQTAELRELINNGGNGNTENVLTYTNVLPSATMGSDQATGWVEGKGYTQTARLSGSSGTVTTNYTLVEGVCASGYIPVTEGDIIRIKGFYPPDGINTYVVAYNGTSPVGYKTFEPVANIYSGDGSWEWQTGDWYSIDKKKPTTEVTATIEMSSANFGSGFNAIRFSGVFSEEVIVTINEELDASTGTGNSSSTGAEKLELIRNWDAPVYDANIPVFQLSAEKAAMTNAAMTPDDIYAKYDALMAKYPHYITKTDLGLCSDGANHVYRYDFMEPDSRHTSGYQWSETKTKAIIVSGIHYEWAGIYGLYCALEEITENPELYNFRRNSHLIVVPCMNPYATIAGNYNGTNGSQGVKNANGVEIHRNFEVGWTLTEAGTLHYGGAQPLSEVETQYVNTIMKENTDAALFLTCHSFGDEGFNFIWPSTATAYTCNIGYRLIDKLSNVWLDKYGDELIGLDDYRTDDIPSWDNRLGFAHISATPGTETRQGTKYGIQSANVEINGRFWTHGTTASPEPSMSAFTMSRGAEVYVNFLLTYFGVYDPKDKTLYS